MAHIYKFAHIINNEIKKIYIFFGQKTTKVVDSDVDISLDELFTMDPENSIFNGLFRPEDIKDINTKSIPLGFIDDYIHLDDTIETIKKKLLIYLKSLLTK